MKIRCSDEVIDIDLVMRDLSVSHPVFISELEFQRALMKAVEQYLPGAYLEAPRRFERIRMDIGLDVRGMSTVIELKYKTRKLEALHGERNFFLKNNSIQYQARYDFVKDITRVERYVKHARDRVGWAILLTNDYLLWESWSSGASEEFRLADGLSLSGLHRWKDGFAAGLNHPRDAALDVQGNYKLAWSDYSDLPGRWGKFRYLAVRVDPVQIGVDRATGSAL